MLCDTGFPSTAVQSWGTHISVALTSFISHLPQDSLVPFFLLYYFLFPWRDSAFLTHPSKSNISYLPERWRMMAGWMGVGRLEENKRSLFLYLSNLNSHGGRTKFPLLFPSIQAYWNYSYLSPCERRSLFSSKQNMFWFYAYEFALEVYSSFRLIIIFICFFLIQILVYVILDGKFRSWGGGGLFHNASWRMWTQI